jgi:hypothetical protein
MERAEPLTERRARLRSRLLVRAGPKKNRTHKNKTQT